MFREMTGTKGMCVWMFIVVKHARCTVHTFLTRLNVAFDLIKQRSEHWKNIVLQ